jgi:hypothetical protein
LKKSDFRKQLQLYFMITHSGRPCKILAERYATIDHEGKTGIAMIVYQPEDRRWEDTDEVTEITRVSYHGEIRVMLVVDGKTKTDNVLDNWVHYGEEI